MRQGSARSWLINVHGPHVIQSRHVLSIPSPQQEQLGCGLIRDLGRFHVHHGVMASVQKLLQGFLWEAKGHKPGPVHVHATAQSTRCGFKYRSCIKRRAKLLITGAIFAVQETN